MRILRAAVLAGVVTASAYLFMYGVAQYVAYFMLEATSLANLVLRSVPLGLAIAAAITVCAVVSQRLER
jgi:hypothetical protein